MKIKPILVGIVCLLALLTANIAGHRAVTQLRTARAVAFFSPKIHLSDDALRMISGEFKGIASDYMLLEIGSFIGSNQKPNTGDWENIARSLSQVLALDPYFQQTYLYIQGNLPWDAKLPEKAISLLEISRTHRPWDWDPGHYIGFDYYYFLKDFENASKMFLETSKIKGAPILFALLGARFSLKTEKSDAAIMLLESMLSDKNLDDYSRKEITQRIADLKAGKIAGDRTAKDRPAMPSLIFDPQFFEPISK